MKISYFWNKTYLGPRLALSLAFPQAELVYTGDDETHYWRELMSRWLLTEDDLVVIEQDITIRREIVAGFESCESSWCVYPYDGLTESLGCTRFRKEILDRIFPYDIVNSPIQLPTGLWLHPPLGCDKCEEKVSVCWRHLDLKIAGALKQAGFKACVHSPEVKHR